MNDNQEKFRDCLREIRNLVSEEIADINAYKIYGREDKQGGNFFKDTRKIRLKFNDYWSKKGAGSGSIWATPDIVGFTIVVSYPSDISNVCSRIDELISRKRLFSVTPEAPIDSDGDTDEIATRFGRAFRSKGYFACHYNVLQNAISQEKSPICEIQIKTLLHDAWGAKTHDLTYKAASPIDPALSKGFEILGDSLAKLDQQSDLLKQSITSQHKLRWIKKNRVLNEVSSNQLRIAFQHSDALRAEEHAILSVNQRTGLDELAKLEAICIEEFRTGDKKWSSIALYFVGFRSGNRRILNNGREALATWENQTADEFAQAHVIGISGLMNYFANDQIGAIDETNRAIELIEGLSVPTEERRKRAFYRRYHSLVSSIAYYYAEIIGSDIGDKNNARANAKTMLDKVMKIRRKTRFCPNSALVKPSTLKRAILNPDKNIAYSNFSSLDNELFTRIQLSEDLAELKLAYDSLKTLHKNPPTDFAEAGVLFDFHDYCARIRLREIELSQIGSSSHP